MEEIWKDIKNFEGLYKISTYGRIYSLLTNMTLKPSITKNGYCLIGLRKNKKYKYKTVHRLVAENFLDNPNKYPCVNHIDGNKVNNKLENLEYCSYSYNEKHAYKNGLKNPRNKPIIQYDLSGNFIKEWASAYEAGRNLNLNIANINSCCNKRKQHSRVGRYIFRFKYQDMEIKEV